MATINGTNGNDNLIGTGSDDVINARGGADTINAGGGDDVIVIDSVPSGSDTINGGAGLDTLVFDSDFGQFTVGESGGAVTFTFQDAVTVETVQGVEQIVFNDQLVYIVGAGGFATIQDAVDAAVPGALILVTSGTYTEQLVIDGKSGLTIEALPGATVNLQAPLDLVETGRTGSDREIHAVVTVLDSTDIVIRGINVDGRGVANTVDEGTGAGQANFYGVFYRNSSGGLEDVDITGIRDPYPGGLTADGDPIVSGNQRGVGLVVDNDNPGSGNPLLSFFMEGGSITDFQKNGTVFAWADLDIHGVTITGGGAQTINAQNGIQASNSTGSIDGNTITNIGYAGTQVVYSTLILGFGNTDLDITNNVITGTNDATLGAQAVGVYLLDFGTANSGGEISGNTLSHVDSGVVVIGDVGPDGVILGSNTYTNIDVTDPFGGGVYFEPEGVTDDNVTGSNGADYINSGDGADTVSALDGDDYLVGGNGADSLDGGDGTDTAGYSGPSSGYSFVVVTDANGFVTGFSSVTHIASGETDTLTSVEILAFSDATFDATDPVQLFDGTDALVGSYATIQDAIDAGADGFTIRVAAGTFAENLIIDSDITIIGANGGIAGTGVRGAETIIDGGILVTADGVTLDGLEFAGSTTPAGGYTFDAGVTTAGNDTVITNSTFTSVAGYVGIQTGGITGLEVSHNSFTGYAIGSYVSGGSTTGAFHNNLFDGIGNGINSETAGVIISDNIFQNLYAGVLNLFPFGPGASVDINDYVMDNQFIDNAGARPIQLYPTPITTGLIGTDDAEAFNGDLSGVTADFSFTGNGGNDRMYGHTGDDTFDGGEGDDGFFGADGTDTAIYTETIDLSELSVVADANPFDAGNQPGWQVASNDEGTDQFDNVEVIEHAGGRILLVGGGGFATIQEAVDAAVDGDVIMVAAGNYAEDVTVDVGVTIVGAAHGTSGSDAGRDAAAGVGETNITGNWVINSASDVTVDGLRFINDATTSGGPSNALISVIGSGGVTGHSITNSIFWSTIVGATTDDRAISISPIAGGAISITDNLISGTAQALFGTASFGRGIWFDGGGIALTASGNTFSWVRTSINLDMSGSSTADISGNNFTNSGTGVALGVDADGVTFTDNDVSNVGTEFSFRNLTTDVTFDADAAIDTLTPVATANDIVIVLGGSGNDTISGTTGDDYIDGNNSPTAPAALDADTLSGGDGTDTLLGRAGDDALDGGAGNDALLGWAGTDSAAYSETVAATDIVAVADADPFTADNQAGWQVTTAGGTDVLSDVEIVTHAGGRTLLVGNGGYDTIQAAVDAAVDGDVILVAAGNYAEDVTVDVAVTILGAAFGDAGTSGGRDASGGVGETNITGNWVINSASDVTVDGLRFINSAATTGGAGNPLISVIGTGGSGDGHSITNSIFWSTIAGAGNGDRAISVSPIATGSISITDNLISGTAQALFGTASWDRGIWFDGGGIALTVDSNTISWTRTAINLDMSGTSTAAITNNNLTNSGSGVSVGLDADGVTFTDNDVTNVGTEFNFRNMTNDVTFDASVAIDVLTPGFAANDTVVILMGSGSDTVTGTSGADYIDGNNDPANPNTTDSDSLSGGDGNDTLLGRAGDDVLMGGAGNDTMTGGLGNDDYYVDAGGDVVGELVGEGDDAVYADTNYILAEGLSIERLYVATATGRILVGNSANNLIYGNLGDDSLAGGDGDDRIEGGAGNDVLIGGEGNDVIFSGAGADTIVGGNGNDIVFVDDAGDTVSGGAGTDEVRSTVNYTLGADIENLRLQGTATSGTGNAMANSMFAGAGATTLNGMDGDDFLYGGGNTDTLNGGNGNDTMFGRNGNDTINGGDGDDVIRGEIGSDILNGDAGADLLFGGVGIDTLHGGDDNDTLRGEEQNDTLYGDAGNDLLQGGDGNDTLYGGAGRDVMTGGAGNDDYRFILTDFAGLTNATADRITDFVQGEDRIRLGDIDANSIAAGDQAFSFIGNAAFSNVAGQLRYSQVSGVTLVSGDVDGDGVADFAIALTGLVTLVGGDFVL